jgi:biopolymer transport protein ExbD
MLGQQNKGRRRVVSEINITPFTDVVLVLLIIFMITTPLLSSGEGAPRNESGFSVNLPEANSRLDSSPTSQLVISILEDGRIIMEGKVVSKDMLRENLRRAKAANPTMLVIVQADRMVNHWRVVGVMDIAAELGIKRLAIATEQETPPPR